MWDVWSPISGSGWDSLGGGTSLKNVGPWGEGMACGSQGGWQFIARLHSLSISMLSKHSHLATYQTKF